MRVKVKISIINDKEESFMGIGLVWLLRKVKDTGSISQAAKDMDMSYAKAHRIIKRLEKNTGKKILDTKTGGIDRGGALLTPFAEDFIDKYDKYQKKVKDYGEKEFLVFLSDIGEHKDAI